MGSGLKTMVRWGVLASLVLALAACFGGNVKRVSEPTARIQSLTVRADGSWSLELRLQNYSSIPMRFQSVSLALTLGDTAAGTLAVQPDMSIGAGSADVVTLSLTPTADARLLLADTLASRRSVSYTLKGRVDVLPEDKKARPFDITADSRLSPVPGLDGVLR